MTVTSLGLPHSLDRAASVARWRWLRASSIALLLLGGLEAFGRAQARPALVLFLHSYDSTYQWTRDLDRGASEALAPAARRLTIRVEYLDARNEPRPDVREQLALLLARKYQDAPPRVIVATDDAAVEFLDAHPQLFGGAPVVFGGVNSAELAARVPRARFTGVTEPTDVNRLIEPLLHLRAATSRVFVVTDGLPASIELRRAVETIARDRARLTVTPLSGDTLSLQQIRDALAEETREDDLVIVKPPLVDVTGAPLDPDEALAQLLAASRAPVVNPSGGDIGQGLLAGIASTALDHGRQVGRKALAVLQGTATAQIAIEPAVGDALVFDAQQMTRWGLSESSLPTGSRVVNHAPSFYRANKLLIWGGLTALLVQSGIIGTLVVVSRSRRRALEALEVQAAALAASNHQLDLTNRSLLLEQEGRQRAEEALRQSQKMDALGRLAGGVAHDFNNLLTVIVGQSMLLAEQLPKASPLHASAAEIRSAGEQASLITRQLLTFSRKQVAPMAPCQVSDRLARLEPIIRRLMPSTVEVQLRLADGLPPLLLGEGQFEQVVLNLVTNARDAMPDGGRLTIETNREAMTDAPLGAPDLSSGSYVVLRVTDTGVGMDEETLRHIFEPFFTTKEPGHGTGVGLATVYGVVHNHGGGVTVSSAPGRGTTMTIYLPVPAGGDRAAAPAPSSPRARDSRRPAASAGDR
jgi:signal transduction histidine kinase